MKKSKYPRPAPPILYSLFSILCLFLLTACVPEEATPTAEPAPAVTATTAPTREAVVPPAQPTAPSALEVADVVIEGWHDEGDVPDVLKTDISLPMVRDDLPGAAEVNDLIAADYGYELGRTAEEYDDTHPWNGGFSYPMYHLRYEVYPFGDLYEICVIGEQYSLYGSGPYWWVNRYYYNAAEGCAATEAEFLEAVGYTEEDLLAAFREEMVMEEDPAAYTYDDVRNHYYIDGEKKPHFWVSLYA